MRSDLLVYERPQTDVNVQEKDAEAMPAFAVADTIVGARKASLPVLSSQETRSTTSGRKRSSRRLMFI